MSDLFAQVIVDLDVPHLDRNYDYVVPPALQGEIAVGQAVKVRFAGRRLTGYVAQLTRSTTFTGRLSPVLRIVSRVPVFTPSTLQTIEYLALRYCASRSQILSLVAPKRVAAVDQQLAERIHSALDESQGIYADVPGAEPATKSVVNCLPADPVPMVAAAATSAANLGATTLFLLPTAQSAQAAAQRLSKLTDLRVGIIDNEQGPTKRYRNYALSLLGDFDILLGTRSAVWTPLPRLQTILIWDDGDDRYQERRAPRFDALDVAVARSHKENVSLTTLSYARSVKDQALVSSNWATEVVPVAGAARSSVPRLRSFDSHDAEREGPTGHMRLPEAAYRLIRETLRDGPVLVQVPAAGYVTEGEDERRTIGSDRIAEELAEAFRGTPVRVSSSTAGILRSVGPESQIVVSTAGAEPEAPGGYAGTIITGTAGLAYSASLNGTLEACRRWMGALALAKPESPALLVGEVPRELWDALVLWKPDRLSKSALQQRIELGFPPARWVVAADGEPTSIAALQEQAEASLGPAQVHLPGTPFAPLTLLADETYTSPEGTPQRRLVVSCSPRDTQQLMTALGVGRRKLSEDGAALPRIDINPQTLTRAEG